MGNCFSHFFSRLGRFVPPMSEPGLVLRPPLYGGSVTGATVPLGGRPADMGADRQVSMQAGEQTDGQVDRHRGT